MLYRVNTYLGKIASEICVPMKHQFYLSTNFTRIIYVTATFHKKFLHQLTMLPNFMLLFQPFQLTRISEEVGKLFNFISANNTLPKP